MTSLSGFSFFQAVRMLQRMDPGRKPVGLFCFA